MQRKKGFNYPNDQTYDLSHRFKNLEDPLRFIENDQIRGLKSKYQQLKTDLRREQQVKAQFSKSIYKKVISRDNEYGFQHDIEGKAIDLSQLYNNRTSKTGGENKRAQSVNKQGLLRVFKHGQGVSVQEKRERRREQGEVPLTFPLVKLIDTPEWQNLRNVQFWGLLRGQDEGVGQLGGGTELDNAAVQAHLQNFRHTLIDRSQYHSKQSYAFLFDSDRELGFWRLQNIFKDEKKSEEDVLATCAFFDPINISIYEMLDFSSRNIEIADVVRFYQLKAQLQAKMENDKNNESLEEKYNEAKRRFQEMKENRLKSKNQRMPAKFISSMAQTNDEMQEKDFQDYFVQDASNIFDRLSNLNAIRDRIVEDENGPTFAVMATNIGQEIAKELFKLLMLVLKGQNFSNYSQFADVSDQNDVERKILELIYLQFNGFSQYEVNGVSKVDIVKRYLSEREKNERFFETYLLKKDATNPGKSKTPTKTKGKEAKTQKITKK